MGFNTATAAAATTVTPTSREIGEVGDFSGVPDYHDTTAAQWVKANTWVDGASLSVSAKALLAKSFNLTAISKNGGLDSYRFLNTVSPPAALAGVTAFPLMDYSSLQMFALIVDAGGVSVQPVGAATGFNTSTGGGSLITSDGATLWNWSPNVAGTSFDARTSPDGKVWTAAVLAGLPGFAGNSNTCSTGPGGTNDATYVGGVGELFHAGGGNAINVVFYAGARHIIVCNGGVNFVAARSADGLAWGGDESVAILGSATIARGTNAWWHRNGNASFLTLDGVARYTADGGATWAASNLSFANPLSGQRFRVNASDPARISSALSGSEYQFSINTGQTWTSRALGFTPTTICGRGATYLACTGSAVYRSIDDGATWAVVPMPAGTVGLPGSVFADSNRFYLQTSGNQVLRSTDGVTWAVANIANALSTYQTMKLVTALDANTVLLYPAASGSDLPMLYTLDGGVTWRWVTRTSHATATGTFATAYRAATTGASVLIGGGIGGTTAEGVKTSSIITAADFALGGAAYRSSSVAISSLRTGASAYVRVS